MGNQTFLSTSAILLALLSPLRSDECEGERGATLDLTRIYLLGSDADSFLAADLDNDGDRDLLVEERDVVSWLENRGDGTFTRPRLVRPRPDADGMVAADFDADGTIDLVVWRSGRPIEAEFFRGKGEATFEPATVAFRFAVGRTPGPIITLIAGNFGGSELIDLFLGIPNGNMALFTNAGEGAFVASAEIPSVGSVVRSFAAGRLNDDEFLDVVTYTIDGVLSISYSRGDGALEEPQRVGELSLACESSCQIVVNDVTDDSLEDIVVLVAGDVLVYPRDPAGGFHSTPLRTVLPLFGPTSFAVGDLNLDGIPDLAIADAVYHNISVFFNTGRGQFANPVEVPVASFPDPVTLEDFNGDGSLDLAAGSPSHLPYLSIRMNLAGGTFPQAQIERFRTDGIRSLLIETRDLDRDGRADVITADSGRPALSLLFGSANGGFGDVETIPIAGFPRELFCEDFDHDGDLDLLTIPGHLLLSDGSTNFVPTTLLTFGSAFPVDTAVADLNGDATPEVIVAEDIGFQQDGRITLRWNRGNGVFERPRNMASVAELTAVAPSDLDGDGDLDLLAASETLVPERELCSQNLWMLENLGDETFTEPVHLMEVEMDRRWNEFFSGVSIDTLDLNQDGLEDVVLGATSIAVFWNAFNVTESIGLSEAVTSDVRLDRVRAWWDVDGDGDLDIVHGDFGSFGVVENVGTGHFATTESWAVGRCLQDLTVADIDNDGRGEFVAVFDTTCGLGVSPGGEVGIIELSSILDQNGNAVLDGCYTQFLRGDCDADGAVGGIGDAVALLHFALFGGQEPPCRAACDADGDGDVGGGVTDALYLLNFTFTHGPAPPPPFPACGAGQSLDSGLGCRWSTCD